MSKLMGLKLMDLELWDTTPLISTKNRFIGDIKIHNDEFNETYYGFENHQGRTFLSGDEKPLGRVVYGNGNNKEDQTEGVHYKTSMVVISTVLSYHAMLILLTA